MPAAVGPLTWNPATDFFATTTNPNGVWTYGWMDTGFKTFTPYVNKHVNPSGYSNWYGWAGDETPAVGFNGQSVPLNNVPAGAMLLHPGNGNEPSVLRWTAPFAATIRAVGQFYAGDGGVMQVAVRHNDSALFTASDAGVFDLPVTVAAGDRIDFAVYGGYGFGSTGLQVALTATAIPLPLTTGDTGKIALASFAGGTAVQIAASGTGDLANSSLQTKPDGSLVVAAGAPWTAANNGAAYPSVAGFPSGDGFNHFVGGGLNYDHGGGSGWMFAGKQTTDTTDPAAIRSGAIVGTFASSPTRDDWFFIGYGRTVMVPRGGATLYLAVNESNNTDNHGSYTLTVSTIAPTNDAFASAEVLTATSESRAGANVLATKESAEPNHAGNTGGASVWWKWTAPKTGVASISTIGSTFDTLLAVYTGNAVNALSAVASDDNSGPANTSKLTFNATAGTVYAIAVDGSGGATGSIVLDVGYAYQFSTVAGLAGTAGSTNATGAAARFAGPNDVVVDSAGNLYVGENSNHTIRKITPSGVVTTLAGSAGVSGTADGTGADARFKQPLGLALDGSGHILVADYENHAIRRVTPAGVVTTLAGLAGTSGTDNATGTAARFNFPVGLVVDAAGNIFVADSANHVIRKIAVDGAVTTFAGTMGSPGSNDGTGTAAKFNHPYRLALDATGHLYVADTFNHSIRKITPAGVVTTLAGSPGVAGVVDGAGSAARFNKPYGLAVDATGNVFTADYVGHTLRKITSTGVVSTLGGLADSLGAADGTGGVARFNAPTGVALDAAGNLFIADFANQTIRRGSLATPPVVNSFAPAVVYAGATVTLTGKNFVGATTVSFNGTAATSFTVVSDTTITAIVPAGATSGNVTVSSPGGTSAAAAAFTVITVAPSALDGFAPNAGGGNANVTQVLAAALQPDGKVIIGGNFTTLQPAGTAAAVNASRLARLNRDGTIDSTFAVSASAEVSAVAVQPDGKILVGNGGQINGVSTGNLARLNPDGTRDNTFVFGGSGGPRRILVLPDGKILVAGAFSSGSIRYPVLRLLADGSLDPAFTLVPITGVLSATITWAYDVVVQSDGKLLVGGYFWTIGGQGIHMLARLNADGSLDPAFDPGLTHNNGPQINRVQLQPDGKILIAGRFSSVAGQNWAHFARLHPNGTLDTSLPALSGAGAMADCVVQSDGRIVVAGGFSTLNGVSRNCLARLLPDGTVDPTFTSGVADPINEGISVLVGQPDGGVLVGGGFNTLGGLARGRIARLRPDGTVERTLALDATANVVGAFALQPNGKLILGGHFDTVGGVARSFVARLNADATLDTTFNPTPNASVFAPVVLADGRFLLGGRFSTIGGLPRNALARFSADGVIDPTFDAAISGGMLNSVVLQSDGKIVIGGTFTSAGGQPRNRLARLNADGSLDTAFNPDVKGEVFGLAIQGDGSIVFSGDFTQVGSATRNRLARVNSAGVLDTAFDPNANNTAYAVAVQADGKLLVAGTFTTIAGETRAGYARLTATGAIDAAFNPATTAGGVTVVQADGKILVGGTFTSIAGAARGHMARLLANGAIDADFNVAADGNVGALALESDGKLFVGGDFSNIGGQARLRFARLAATGPTATALTATPSTVTLTRTGPLPELSWVTLEKSTDLTTWTALGTATRIGATANWQLTGQSLPTATLFYLRARAAAPTGVYGASSLVEHVQQVYLAPVGPTITTQPLATTVAVGASATLSVTATGATGYQWVRNGNSIPNATSSTLTFSPVTLANWGNYYVLVNGPAGTTQSNGVTLTVTTPVPVPILSASNILKTPRYLATDGTDWFVSGVRQDNSQAIFKFPIGGGTVSAPYAGLVSPLSVTVIGSEVYWIDPNGGPASDTRILKAPKSGVGPVTAIYSGSTVGEPLVDGSGLATDGTALYAADEYAGKIFKLNPDGTNLTAFSAGPRFGSGFNNERVVIIAHEAGVLYGADINRAGATASTPSVFSSPVSGSAFTSLASGSPLVSPAGVAVMGGKLYVSDPGANNTIWQLPLTGGTPAVYSSGAPFLGLAGLAAYNGELYVADSAGGAIYRLVQTAAVPPAITSPPTAVVTTNRANVTFSVTATGIPAVTYQWRFNGNPIPNATSATLALTNVGSAQVGNYSVTVANGLDSITTTPVALTGPVVEPTFTTQPVAYLSANVGSAATFSVAASATAGVTYQWRKFGQPIAGATSTTLTVPNLTLGDAGLYDVVVTTSGVAFPSTASRLDVQAPIVSATLLTASPNFAPRFENDYAFFERLIRTPDGKIYISGEFSSLYGVLRPGFARLDAAGTLDTTFAPAPVRHSYNTARIYAVAAQADGRILIGGQFGTVGGYPRDGLARLNADGSVDPSFVPPANLTNSERVLALAIQPDGKILVGGSFNDAGVNIVRLHADGSRDTTFLVGTGFSGPVNALVLQADGKVVVGGGMIEYKGTSVGFLARLTATGALDTAYRAAGGFGFNAAVHTLVLQPDGKLLVGGDFTSYGGSTRARLARLLDTGALDTAFSIGTGFNNRVSQVALQSDGGVIAVGDFTTFNDNTNKGIVRLTSGGAHDTTFVTSSELDASPGFNDGADGVALLANGVLVLSNDSNKYASPVANVGPLTRLTAFGALDTSFTPAARSAGSVLALMPAPGGKWLVGGQFNRVNGTARGNLARLNSDYTLDQDFIPSGAGFGGAVKALAVQPDGKVLVGGAFTTFNSLPANRLVRLTSAGPLDTTFDVGTGSNGEVFALALDASARVLVGGQFTSFNGTARHKLLRLTPAGVLDPTFTQSGVGFGTTGDVGALAVLADGRIYAGGSFSSYAGAACYNIARFLADGALDSAFATGLDAHRVNSRITALVAQPDGKLLLGGQFYAIGDFYTNGLGRLNADGTRDTTFGAFETYGDINALHLQSDGRIVVAGAFSQYGYGDPPLAIPHLARVSALGVIEPAFQVVGFSGTPTVVRPGANGALLVGGESLLFPGGGAAGLARLDAAVGPVIATAPFQQIVAVGAPAGFSVTATGGSLAYQWTKDGVAIPGANGSALTLTSAQPADAGNYAVTVKNIFGSVTSAPVALTGPGAAPVISAITAAPATVGSAATLTATVTGATSYQWRKLGQPVTGHASATTATLTLPAVSLADAGFYDLLAYNGLTRTRSAVARLVVQPSGTIQSPLRVDRGFAGVMESVDSYGLPTRILAQPDGSYYVAGNFTSVDGVVRFNLARFSASGVVDAAFNAEVSGGSINALARQADGKLVLVGDFHRVNGIECNHLARLNTDGTLDSAFPQGPGTGTQESLYAVAIQSDQKILLGGELDGYGSTFNLRRLARLNADGTLDTAFTTALQDGFNDTVRAIAVHTDGRIYVVGDFTQFNGSSSANHVVALNADGSRFALPGIVAEAFQIGRAGIPVLGSVSGSDGVEVSTIVVQPDGKLVVGGNFESFRSATARGIIGLAADGSADPSFINSTGANAPVTQILRQSDGQLYATGWFSSFDNRTARVVRLTATGAFDRGYDFDGTPSSIALGAGNDLLVVGDFQTYRIPALETASPRSRFARFDAAGALTPSQVNRWGTFEGYVETIIPAPGGKWLVAGYFRRVGGARVDSLARLNADGSFDSTFSTVEGPFNTPRALAVQGDGKILVGGVFEHWGNESASERTGSLVRLLPDGTRDTAFTHGTGFNSGVSTLLIQPDGKIVVGGDFTSFDDQPIGARLARLNADGTLDTSFATGTGFDQTVRALAFLSEGRLLVAGDFGRYQSATDNVAGLVRLQSNGVLETVYNVVGGRVSVIAPQADGGFLIGGGFYAIDSQLRSCVARLTPAGVVDAAFNTEALFQFAEVSPGVSALVVQPDGRVIVSGRFEDVGEVGGTAQLARLTATGALDPTFRAHFNGTANALALRPDGSLLIAGSELTANETYRQGLLALGGSTVVAAPTITNPPAAVVATSGTTATFSVTASGDGLTYQWRRFGLPIPGATSATLNLPGVTLASADVYEVVITNPTGASVTSTPVPLAVAPVVTPGALVLDDRFDLPFERELSDLASDAVTQVQALASGKFLVAGGFSRIGGVPRSRLARFNADGTVDLTFVPPAISHPVSRFVVQPDGKIVIAGDFYRVGSAPAGGLARLHADGALDAAFPAAGVSNVHALALQSDGKILVGGQISSIGASLTRPGVARFTTAGAPDATFDAGLNPGAVVRAIALQTLDSTEKILLGGSFATVGGVTRNNLARVTLTGALDATFSAATTNNGPDGQVNAILAVDTAGAVVIGGAFSTVNGVAAPRLARLAAADGALDTAFLSTVSGTVNGTVNALALQPSGDLVVVGSFTAFSGGAARLRLARVSLTGLVDPAFAPTANSTVSTVALQADGAILVGGSFSEVNGTPRQHLARLSTTGVADTAVDPTLLAPAGVRALVHAAGGGVLVGGSFTHVGGTPAPALVRLDASGQLDAAFNAGGVGFVKGSVVTALAPVGDGRVTVIGSFPGYNGVSRPSLLRLEASGALDTSFAPSGGFSGNVSALLALPGGRILVAGSFTTYNGITRNGLALLRNDASLDTAFAAPASPIPFSGLSLARQTDGKILIGGDFTSYAGTAANRLVRLNLDGTLDTPFLTAVGTGPNAAINALQPLSDGRLVVAGGFTTWNGNAGSTYAVRLLSTGERDNAFQVQATGFGIVSLILQADGKLIERGLGSLSGTGASSAFGFGRLTTEGSADNSFYVTGVAGFNSGDRAMLQLDDGTLLVAGDSTLTLGGGFQRLGLARLIAFVSPAIVTPPVAQTIPAGGTATFSVVADGGAVNSYQWFRGTTLLTGANSPVLVLKNLTPADAGNYTVQISNALGTVTSTPVALTVNDLPVIVTPPAAQSAVFGGSATFSVVATGSPTPTYQWQRNGLDIPSATNSTYMITSASQDDAGAYRVVVTNSVGFVRSEPVEFAVVTRNLINFYARAIVAARGTIATSFTVEGTQPKTVLIVGVGGTRASTAVFTGVSSGSEIPRAGSAALPPAGLADPRLVVVNSAGTLVGSNDNWTTANVTALTAASAQVGATPGLTTTGEGANDAALLLTLAPGTYHATLDSADTAGGAALLQVYDADTDGSPRLVMFTLRANVASGDNVATAGFTIDGKLPKTVLIRALGEGLGASPGVLVDPVIELFRGTTSLARNDDTYFSSGSDIPPTVGLVGARPVSESLDSTLVRTLAPGAYTVQLTPYNSEESGTVLFELFESDAQRASVIAPVITYLSPNQFAVQGGAARFGVVVVAKPGATYQWRKNGAPIDGAVGPVLTLENVQSGDATNYDVVITSGASTVTSSSRTLSILPEFHSADTDRDRRIGLLELTRIIQFYNYRVGTVRTGEYHTLDGTEDGFTLGGGSITTHHTADSNRDGRIDIVELTRVIELFNHRSGTARTGEYHAVVGTEDGFTPGPDVSRLRSPKVR